MDDSKIDPTKSKWNNCLELCFLRSWKLVINVLKLWQDCAAKVHYRLQNCPFRNLVNIPKSASHLYYKYYFISVTLPHHPRCYPRWRLHVWGISEGCQSFFPLPLSSRHIDSTARQDGFSSPCICLSNALFTPSDPRSSPLCCTLLSTTPSQHFKFIYGLYDPGLIWSWLTCST